MKMYFTQHELSTDKKYFGPVIYENIADAIIAIRGEDGEGEGKVFEMDTEKLNYVCDVINYPFL